jgi:hypothetical protein
VGVASFKTAIEPMLVELAIGDAYGAGFEYAADRIPRLVSGLENGLFGRDYLSKLDRRLMERG